MLLFIVDLWIDIIYARYKKNLFLFFLCIKIKEHLNQKIFQSEEGLNVIKEFTISSHIHELLCLSNESIMDIKIKNNKRKHNKRLMISFRTCAKDMS
ncbi:hypothetical protein BpHYR1_035907 [Brachionus plicatilis]|uniref:Uncharacterized protein n=1 Tax=Brachionus plicatilis TaxID=10195 RepID=A0A3M7SHK2_BRAPC|nr:hypothetical protein BpHYR1_035907 [Brachionus plicatilis]